MSGGVAVTVKSVAQQVADLRGQVTALKNARVLNGRQARSLMAQLHLKGKVSDVRKVKGFLGRVRGLKARTLTAAQAEALLDAGTVLLRGVTIRKASGRG
jgi:hypothetical protein